MGNRSFRFQKDTFYHIYNRGFNKQQLFFAPRDYERFYNNIPRYKEKYPNILIPAWNILPNHFHFILIEQSSSPGVRTLQSSNSYAGQISPFMQKLQQAYAAFFNAKYRDEIKQGLKMPVFEGRFGAREVPDEKYLEALKNYIEWNAVKHEIVKKPEEWGYQSEKSSNSLRSSNFKLVDDFDPFFE